MADIDELRGAPKGSTKDSITAPEALRKAARAVKVAAVISSGVASPTVVQAAEHHLADKDAAKIETVTEVKSPETRADTISFEDALSANAETQTPTTVEVSNQTSAEIQPATNAEISAPNLSADDIQYYPDADAFLVKEETVIQNQDLDYKQTRKDFIDDLKQQYKEDPLIDSVTYSSQDLLDNVGESRKLGYQEGNSVTFVKIDVDRNVLSSALSPEAIDRLEKSQTDLIIRDAVLLHELEHLKHDRLGIYAPGISPEHVGKLNMHSEICANLTSLGQALEIRDKTGSLEGFDVLHNCANWKDMKQFAADNPDLTSKDLTKVLVPMVQEGWLQKNNVANSTYSKQAENLALDGNYTVLEKLYDADFLQKNYQERVKQMYKNVEGLGDVRDYVKMDFELNGASKDKIRTEHSLDAQSRETFASVTLGVDNYTEATRKLDNFLKPIKEADKDGVRTPEETAKIEKHIANVIETAQEKQEKQAEKQERAENRAEKKQERVANRSTKEMNRIAKRILTLSGRIQPKQSKQASSGGRQQVNTNISTVTQQITKANAGR